MSNLVKGAKRSSLTKALKLSARTNEGKVYVLPTKGRWGVKKEGSTRFYRVMPTKAKALIIAKRQAANNGSHTIIVQKADGMIEDYHTID